MLTGRGLAWGYFQGTVWDVACHDALQMSDAVLAACCLLTLWEGILDTASLFLFPGLIYMHVT